MRAGLLLVGVVTTACSASLDLAFEDGEMMQRPPPRTIDTPEPTPAPATLVWRSWDVALNTELPERAFVISTSGDVRTSIDLYGAQSVAQYATPAFDLDVYGTTAPTGERLLSYWQDSAAGGTPRIGKSSLGRGAQPAETDAPSPLGVLDLQLHPANPAETVNGDRPAVAAFVVPVAGTYRIEDFAFRIVEPDSAGCEDGVRVLVFGSGDDAHVDLTAALADNTWKRGPAKIPLGNLAAGARVYFVLSSVEVANASNEPTAECDGTEIAWKLVREPLP